MINKITNGFYFILAGLLSYSCANPVTPSGGPKDKEPPQFVKSEPPMFSRSFNESRIKITFNEFIQLKKLNEQIIISPPMATTPEFKLRGKSLFVELQGGLKENTTYNIFFGNAIVDLTEGNPLENFQYIFSTGNVIDSLSIKGQLYNAYDLQPVKSVNVMLYTNNNDTIPFDSLPYFVKPYYMTKTDETGNFSLKNLAYLPYKIFALNDMNGNLIYDQPGELIGFLKDSIFPSYQSPNAGDSLRLDTLIFKKDLSMVDSTIIYKMGIFQEIDSSQKLLKTTVPKKNQINFIFKRPVSNLSIHPYDLDFDGKWAIEEYNRTKDTIIYWIKDVGKDSLKLEISVNKIILDTINLALFKKSKGKKGDLDDEKAKKLEIKYNIKNSVIDLNKPLILTFGYPLKSIDTTGIQLYESDSILVKAIYSYVDSVNRKIKFENKWKKSTKYTLSIQDSIFTDMLDHQNDSIKLRFTSKSLEEYGNLFVNIVLSDTCTNYIVQLMSGELIVREAAVNKSERLIFTYLIPGKYTLKVIDDENKNGHWDTGDYIYKVQPERVRLFPAEINIRSNWDIEEEWKL